MSRARLSDAYKLAAIHDIPVTVIMWRIRHNWPDHILGEKTIPYSIDPVMQKPEKPNKRKTLTLKK